jgi:hypothetical protein
MDYMNEVRSFYYSAEYRQQKVNKKRFHLDKLA